MDRTKGILAAGTLTGLVLITMLALGFGNVSSLFGNDATAVPETAAPAAANDMPLPETSSLSNEEALQAWQQYSAELEQTVNTMQDRENTYQAQLEAANQTILQLQDEINSANSAPAYSDDDDDYEEHEYDDDDEHEEHEYDEHEEHEEHDDDD